MGHKSAKAAFHSTSAIHPATRNRKNRREVTRWEPLNKSNIHTFAFAFSYALVHAGAKSGTNAGFSTGGGCLGELAGYTPGIGGSDDGEGKATKAYGVLGLADGPGSVSTLILVVVDGTEEDVDELLLAEEDKLAGLDVGVTEDDDCGGGEGAAVARATARRMRMAEDHMDVEWGHPVDRFGRTGKGKDHKGENRREELYRLVSGSVGTVRRSVIVAYPGTSRSVEALRRRSMAWGY